MTDETTTPEEPQEPPKTAAEAAGSVFGRLKHPVSTSGAPRQRSSSASATEIEGEVLRRGNMAADVPDAVRPRRKVGRRRTEGTPAAEAAAEAHLTRPGDEEGTHFLPDSEHGASEPLDPREDKFAELLVAALFGLATLATIGVCVAFFAIPEHERLGQWMNFALGGGLAIALLSVGAGMVLWAKRLIPHDLAVQERHNPYSPEEEELLAEDTFIKGVTTLGLGQRPILRRSLLGAMSLLPVPALLLLWDLGPMPRNSLRKAGWKAGVRLVDVETKLPIKLGDLDIGGIKTVMPEGFGKPEEHALAPTMLIRFAPNEIRSKKERAWSKNDHVAYSKICTHAGCPISLYEQQTHHLLCPCHQSTFDMANDAKVIFGPAARNLPQLQLDIDSDGYFIAKAPYNQPVGPSYWERG
ncbi:MAG: ubiquinol-cytochrome c reductase iron-sulfur subunit [Frankiaceae bacterium]|jgi:ubiquinol-cytochrome c reductase iron-sulfur subunit|nr:ubiquinol-cytochrome c reductase iron-sulfur subunit [Frankiaceae bacterium]